jgi:hypothetical protein
VNVRFGSKADIRHRTQFVIAASIMASGVDRAIALAKSGQYRSVAEIFRHLAPADRPALEAHLAQPDARRQLILLCSAAWLETQ